MGVQPAASDPETTSFEATVESVTATDVVLDRTYFYAESGGQPSDRGMLDGIRVEDVTLTEEGIVHTLADEPAFVLGDLVVGEVDLTFRTYCRRAHSASHVLYGVARGLLADLGYGGFGIDERKVRIDFETSTHVDDAVLVDLDDRANRAVWESRPVTWETVSEAEVHARDGVAFNTKTEEGVFGADDDVRLVEIGAPSFGDGSDWLDRAACGGTHVRNTREIGPITVLDRSNPGEGLTRIELAVGPTAIDDRTKITRAARDAANTLGVGVMDLPNRVEGLRSERDALQADLQDAIDRAIATQLATASPIERDGRRWIVEPIDGGDPDALATHARTRVDDETDVVVLVSNARPVSMAVATDGEVDASEVIDDVTTAFGGGGGGSGQFAQGGGIDTDPERVVDHLAE